MDYRLLGGSGLKVSSLCLGLGFLRNQLLAADTGAQLASYRCLPIWNDMSPLSGNEDLGLQGGR
jgi:hypothetical protein